MKNLIKKILKEEQDEFEWARGLDVSMAEKEIKQFFVAVEYDHGFEGPELYHMLVDANIRDINKLQEIGKFLYDEVESVYDRGKEAGYENCDCDGCCDDYVWYQDADRDKEEAREEEEYQNKQDEEADEEEDEEREETEAEET